MIWRNKYGRAATEPGEGGEGGGAMCSVQDVDSRLMWKDSGS